METAIPGLLCGAVLRYWITLARTALFHWDVLHSGSDAEVAVEVTLTIAAVVLAFKVTRPESAGLWGFLIGLVFIQPPLHFTGYQAVGYRVDLSGMVGLSRDDAMLVLFVLMFWLVLRRRSGHHP